MVVHQIRFLAGKSGRADYALSGETFELSCHYIMKDGLEDIKQLVWSKDGQNVSTGNIPREAAPQSQARAGPSPASRLASRLASRPAPSESTGANSVE